MILLNSSPWCKSHSTLLLVLLYNCQFSFKEVKRNYNVFKYLSTWLHFQCLTFHRHHLPFAWRNSPERFCPSGRLCGEKLAQVLLSEDGPLPPSGSLFTKLLLPFLLPSFVSDEHQLLACLCVIDLLLVWASSSFS